MASTVCFLEKVFPSLARWCMCWLALFLLNFCGTVSADGVGSGRISVELIPINLDMYFCQILRDFDSDQITNTTSAIPPDIFSACDSGDWTTVGQLISESSDLAYGHSHDELTRILFGALSCQDAEAACTAHSASDSEECELFAEACSDSSHHLAGHYLSKLQRVLLQSQADGNETDDNPAAAKLAHMDSVLENANTYCNGVDDIALEDADDILLQGDADGQRTYRFLLANPQLHQNISDDLGVPSLLSYVMAHEALLHCLCHPNAGHCLPQTLALSEMAQQFLGELTQPMHPNVRAAYNANETIQVKHATARNALTPPLASLKSIVASSSALANDNQHFGVRSVEALESLVVSTGLKGLAAFVGWLIDAEGVELNKYLGNKYGLGIWMETVTPSKVRVANFPLDYQVELRKTVPTQFPPIAIQFAINIQFPNDLSLNGQFSVCIVFLKELRQMLVDKVKAFSTLASKFISPIVNAVYGAFSLNEDGCINLVQVKYSFVENILSLLLLPVRIDLWVVGASFRAFWVSQFSKSPVLSSVGMRAECHIDTWLYSKSLVFVPAWTFPQLQVWKAKYTNSDSAIPAFALKAVSLDPQPAILPSNAATYLNCYPDSLSSHLLKFQASGHGYTAQTCMNAVWSIADYFGLENGGDCWYGSLSDKQFAALNTTSACNVACTAVTSQRCGGASSLDMYAIVGNPNPTSFTSILPTTSSSGAKVYSFNATKLYSPYQLAWIEFNARSGNAMLYTKVKYSNATSLLWQSGTNTAVNRNIAQFGLFNQCQLCVTDAKNVPVWCTPATAVNVNSGCSVRLYDNGVLTIVDAGGNALWWPGVVIGPNQSVQLQDIVIKSPTGVANLQAQANHNLAAYNANGQITFTTQTNGTAASYVIMQADCNLCMYPSTSKTNPIWCSLTTGLAPSGSCFFTLDDDANVAIVDNQGNTLWMPGVAISFNQTVPFNGLSVYSPTGQTKLTFSTTGNLQVSNNQKTTFSSGTSAASRVSMQPDCNLCIFNAKNEAIWCSGTAGASTGCQVMLNECGAISIVDRDGNMVWPSAAIIDAVPAFSFCSSGPTVLQAGGQLLSRSSQSISSPSGLAKLVAQSDGNVVVTVGGVVTWQSGTAGLSNIQGVTLQADCNLVVTNSSGAKLWHSNTGVLANTVPQNSFGTNCLLDVTDCGTIRIISNDGMILWAAGSPSFKAECYTTLVNVIRTNSILRFDGVQTLSSLSGRYKLTAQKDGNLVLSGSNQVQLWNSNTAGKASAYLLLRSDCNLCIYSSNTGPGSTPIWCAIQQSGAVVGASQDCQLQLSNCGVLSLSTSNGTLVWAQGGSDFADPSKCGGLLSGDSLSFQPVGQAISSPNGAYSLAAQSNGDLVFSGANNQQIWHSATAGSKAQTLLLQSLCQLEIFSTGTSAPIWTSPAEAASQHEKNCSLAIDNCGLATIYDEQGRLVSYLQSGAGWQSAASGFVPSNCDQTSLSAGQSLSFNGSLPASNVNSVNAGGWTQTVISEGGFWRLTAQKDGDLCMYGPNDNGVWCAGTKGKGSASLMMQNDCNLCIYPSTSKSPIWCSGTANAGSSSGSCTLSVSDCGLLYIADSVNGVVWHQGVSGFGDATKC